MRLPGLSLLSRECWSAILHLETTTVCGVSSRLRRFAAMNSLSVPRANRFERKKAPDCSICATRVPAKSSVIWSLALATVAVARNRSNSVATASYSAVTLKGRSDVRHAISAKLVNISRLIRSGDTAPSAIHRSLFRLIVWQIIPKN